jgi:hypothetical protein
MELLEGVTLANQARILRRLNMFGMTTPSKEDLDDRDQSGHYLLFTYSCDHTRSIQSQSNSY